MKYGFTLQPGTMLGQSRDLTMRMQRAPVNGDQVAPAPAPVVQTNYFLEEFKGGGDLSTHTPIPNIGNYALVPGDPGALTDLQLDSTQGLKITDTGLALEAWSPIAELPDDYFIEIVGDFVSLPGGFSTFVGAALWDSVSNTHLLELTFEVGSIPIAAFLALASATSVGGSDSTVVNASPSYALGTELTALAHVTPTGVAVSVNGAPLWSTAVVPDKSPDRLIVHSEYGGTGAIGVLKSVRVYTQA